MDENRITYFAETDARNRRAKFGIKPDDRRRHVYVIGKTGMGKSTLLENMAVQDIQSGQGVCFIDPHGKTADLLLEYVPKERVRDVIYIAPFDTDFPISFNVLESVDPQKRHLVVSGLMSTFKKIWVDAWSARMEYILTNTLLALLEAPNTTLLGVNRMLSDKAYRNEIVSQVQDPSVKSFWVKEFANYTERMAAEAVPAIQNKVGQFTANPLIRNMIGQAQSSFNFREAMDSRKIIIINLSKGKIGDENMKLLGGLLVTKIYLAAMSRADASDRVMKMLPDFYLYVDEFQNFANASFADILSEARKYKLNLTIAHQYIEQMDEFVRPAVFGNVGTMIVFRVGAADAEELEKEFAPTLELEDLVNLGQYQIYLKLMIDGLTSPPFSATNLPPILRPDISYVKEIIDASREQFARPRAGVEEEIVQFHLPTVAAKPAAKATAIPLATAGALPSKSASSEIAPIAGNAVPKIIPASAGNKSTSAPIVSSNPPTPSPTLNKAQILPSVQTPKPASPPAAVPAKPVSAPIAPRPAPVAPSAIAPATAPVPMPAPVVQAVKPVSLSSLKQPPRQDPKVASPENVSELRNALQAILGKNAPSVKKETPEVRPSPAPQTPQAPKAVPQIDRPKLAEESLDGFMPLSSLKNSPSKAPSNNSNPPVPPNPSASIAGAYASAPILVKPPQNPSPKNPSVPNQIPPPQAPKVPPPPQPPAAFVKSEPFIPEPPKEVPEDVLKKILKIE